MFDKIKARFAGFEKKKHTTLEVIIVCAFGILSLIVAFAGYVGSWGALSSLLLAVAITLLSTFWSIRCTVEAKREKVWVVATFGMGLVYIVLIAIAFFIRM
ncbi:MAG: hypothetical protein RR505_01390 [Raoultibacter sp.]